MLLGSVSLDASSPSHAPVTHRDSTPETLPAPASQTMSESLAPYLLGAGIPAASLVGYVIYKNHKEKTKLDDLDLPLDDKNTRSEKVRILHSIYIAPPMEKKPR